MFNEVVVSGKVDKISPVKVINDNFSLMTVVVETQDERPQFIEVEFSNGRMDNVSGLEIGDTVEITAKLHGRKAMTKTGENVFNKISAYKIKITK